MIHRSKKKPQKSCKCFKTNENENTTHQNLFCGVKASLRGKLITIKYIEKGQVGNNVSF